MMRGRHSDDPSLCDRIRCRGGWQRRCGMSERAPPKRHPSTAIPEDTIREIAYRVYIARLEPPLTLEQAEVYHYVDDKRRVTDNASLRRNARAYESLIRTHLRVLVDMGMVPP